jgi:2-oxoglutarate ferredoxin oxidoreductase subunit alpha
VSGNISYEPENHSLMSRLRAERVLKVADDIPDLEVDGDPDAEVLVLGWGSSYGTIRAAARRVRLAGKPVAVAHLHHLNPLPLNTGDVVRSYRKVIVPEMNMGQLVKIIRAEFLVDADSVTKMEGQPFFAEELEREILERI